MSTYFIVTQLTISRLKKVVAALVILLVISVAAIVFLVIRDAGKSRFDNISSLCRED